MKWEDEKMRRWDDGRKGEKTRFRDGKRRALSGRVT